MNNNSLKRQLEGHVGMCLKKRREALNLKRSDVAKLIDVKPKLIKAAKNGHASLSLYQFHRLLHHLSLNAYMHPDNILEPVEVVWRSGDMERYHYLKHFNSIRSSYGQKLVNQLALWIAETENNFASTQPR